MILKDVILQRLDFMVALTVQIRTLGPEGPISPRSPLGPGRPCNNVTKFIYSYINNVT